MENSEKILQDIQDIRSLMERSGRFLSLSGWSGISAGLIAMVGALVVWNKSGSTHPYFADALDPVFLLTIAAVVLFLALGSAVFFSWQKARKQKLSLWNPVTKRLLFYMAVPLVTGGLLSLILLKHNLGWLLAGSTLIFYGLSLVAAGRFTNREAVILGIAEIVLGLVALAVPTLSIPIWALGFGLFHVIYGLILYHKYDKVKS